MKKKTDINYSTIIFMFLTVIFILVFILVYRKVKYDNIQKKKKSMKLILNKEIPKQIIFIHPNENDISDCWEKFFSFDKNDDEVENKNLLTRPKYINKPDIIYVLKNKNYKTIENLSKKLNIEIKNTFSNETIEYLVDNIMSQKNKNILVCWEYYNIPNIVQEIIDKLYTNQPCDMSDDDKNLVWNYNPFNYKEDPLDFSTIWTINFIDNKLSLTSYKGVYLKDDQTCNFNLAGNNFQYQKYPCQNYFQIEYFK